ncbi:MAG: cysteine desulfurase family protein [Lachnospirales bacterium]
MIYLDNAATTKTCDLAIKKIIELNTNNFGNPSSLHNLGINSEKEIINSKKEVAKILKVKEKEIFFTSGATESNNLAIQGTLSATRKKHIITTKAEHPSVLANYKILEKKGYTVTYLKLNKYGEIDLKELQNTISEDTALVSIMHVNNETGAISPINEIKKILKDKNIIFHIDGVQGFCKLDIDCKDIDIYTFSGHKIFCPKGSGGLYIKTGTKINSILNGGEQMEKIRPGTENISAIAAIGAVSAELNKNIHEHFDYVLNLKKEFLKITEEIEGIKINGQNTSPYICSLYFENLKGEVLLHALESDEIYVSTGSSCSSKSKNAMLHAYGFQDPRVDGTVRFSFSINNSQKEIILVKDRIKYHVDLLRKFVKR